MNLRRRQILKWGGGLCLAAATPAIAQSENTLAEKRGIFYGCAMKSLQIHDDPDFTAAVLRECNAIVPEYELKRIILQPEPDRYDFAGGDLLADFAGKNGLRMRGHTLVWHIANPAWLENELATAPSEKKPLLDYIEKVTTHYGKRLEAWDVVNEAIGPEEGDLSGLRVSSPWHKAFGPDYVDHAFRAAREHAPDAMLFYNDYGVEMDGPWYKSRRYATLKLLEGLRKRNVPVDAFGIQGHLIGFDTPFDEKVYAHFLDEVVDLGYKIAITEFDISDRNGPADPAERDKGSAELAKRFLDVTLDCKALTGIMSWGLSDRYIWVPDDPNFRRADGQDLRPLPLDTNLTRKPMWYAMAAAFGT